MKLKTLFLAALAVLAIASCDTKKKMILGVQLDPAEIYLTKEDNAGQSFEVYASDSWTVTSTADWLTISQDKGKGDASLSVSATANHGKPRKATVVFRCGYYHYATLTVTQQGDLEASDGSSPEKAFTSAEARELVLDPSGSLDPEKSYFVKGKIHKIASKGTFAESGTNGNASFYISEDGKASADDFYCYRVLYLGNRKFKSGDTDIKVGDEVIIYGQLTNYNGTPETVQGNAFVYDLNGVHEDVQTEFEEITIAEFLDRKDENTEYIVSGKVTSVTPEGSYYGANIADGGKTLQCAFPSNWNSWKDKVAVGGTMKIQGKYSLYNGNPQMSNGKVLSFEEGQVIIVTGSVSDAIAAEDGSEVTVSDAIVAALTTKGFVVTDGTSNGYVYQNGTPTIAIGDKISFKGKKTTYREVPEIETPTDIQKVSSGNTVPMTVLTNITGDPAGYSSTVSDYIAYTGVLTKSGNYYNIATSNDKLVVSANQPNAAMASVLDGLNGQEITLLGYFAGKNTTSAGITYINIIATDASASGGAYCRPDKTEISVAAEATSAKFNISANAAWTLQAPDAEGFQSISPMSGSANAEVTASFSANTSAQNRTFEILLTCADASVSQTIAITQLAAGASTGESVTAAVAKATDAGVAVEIGDAIVAALTQRGFVITDGTTNCYVFINPAPTNIKIGDKVSLKGNMKIYYKLPEVTNPADITVISSGNQVPRTTLKDITAEVGTYDATAAEYISFTGNLIKDGNYYNIKKAGETIYVSASYPSADMTALMDPLLNNDVIVTGYYNTKNTGRGYLGIIVTDVQAADPNAKHCYVAEGNSINVAASATSTTLNVKANAAWSISASSGATVSPASGSADAAVTVSFAANTATSAKTYTLTLVCADASVNQAITITQAAAGGSGGEGSLQYTLDGTITGGTNGYAEASDITQNGVTWKVMGNTTMSPWRIGGKSLTNEKRTVYSTGAISANISKIKIEHGTADGVTVNSLTITVHSSAADAASGSNAIATFTPTFAANSAVEANKSGSASWAGCYYRFVYDITVSVSSNKFIQFKKAEFYGN